MTKLQEKYEALLKNTRAEMESTLGTTVRVNVRPDYRTPPDSELPELYKVQVELEAYVEGPGQARERREAEERAAKARAEEEAAAKERAEAEAQAEGGQ